MLRGRSDPRVGWVQGLTALVLLLSFAAVEIHLASHDHRPAAAEPGVEPHSHLTHPAYFEKTAPSLDRRCLVCLLGSQRRGSLGFAPSVLPQQLAIDDSLSREYPVLASAGFRRPVSRGPPSLL
jgi:hypothetical protein